jgi:hypothetical protein
VLTLEGKRRVDSKPRKPGFTIFLGQQNTLLALFIQDITVLL